MENPAQPRDLPISTRARRFFGLGSQGGAATQEQPAAAPQRFGTAQSRPKILLVEDDHDLRHALNERLTHDGCDVTEAADGVSARWSLLSCRYDAVILDLTLPSSSGVEVMADVSRNKPLPPTLVLTGGEAEERDRARAMGATFVLKKPSPYAVVADALDRLLG